MASTPNRAGISVRKCDYLRSWLNDVCQNSCIQRQSDKGAIECIFRQNVNQVCIKPFSAECLIYLYNFGGSVLEVIAFKQLADCL